MSKQVTEPDIMNHLGFIRLLYLQGIEQTEKPYPLNLTCILTFHDAVELFLVLSCDHLGAPLPRRDPGFLEYWSILEPSETFADGVHLYGKPAMDKLNRHRNGLKHAGAMPGPGAVSESSASASRFFETNTNIVFGLNFDAIDMADLVPQPETRDKVKAAAQSEANGERAEAMGLLGEAFAELFEAHGGSGGRFSPYGFGGTVSNQPFLKIEQLARHAASGARLPQDRSAAQHMGRQLDDHLNNVTTAVGELQRGMRVLALGMDFARYRRFAKLTPTISGSGPYRHALTTPGYSPTEEDYNYCSEFVITVALRLAELDSWDLEPQ
jgi:hypothetical protein